MTGPPARNPPSDESNSTEEEKKKFPPRIDVSYVCGMCIVSFLYANFFLPCRKPLCVHHAWGKREEKAKEERHGFRAWKILKIFLPPASLGMMESLRDFICRTGGGELGEAREVALVSLLYFQFHLYLFIFLYKHFSRFNFYVHSSARKPRDGKNEKRIE